MKFRTLTVLFSQSMFKSASGLHIVSKPFSYNIFIFSLALGLFAGGGGGGGATAIYGLYRYVPLRRVWFSSSLLKDRVYRSERLEEGIILQETDQLVEDFF